jgi:putative phosphoribosyl transferase
LGIDQIPKKLRKIPNGLGFFLVAKRVMRLTKFFYDRKEAGQELAKKLQLLKPEMGVVLGLPRGGVPVAYEVVKSLSMPLSVVVSRKIGHPFNQEFAVGAVSENNTLILNPGLTGHLEIDGSLLKHIISREVLELKRRQETYLAVAPRPQLAGKTVILVDDGLATGMTARASVEAVKKHKPKRIIFSVPVCAKQSLTDFKAFVDQVICVIYSSRLKAIGQFYRNFEPVSDKEVIRLLAQARNEFS